MKIVDAHAHICNGIKGERLGQKLISIGYGKVKMGEEVQQLLPPFLERNVFSPEMLIGLMDQNEVEYAILLQNPVLGILNEQIKETLHIYPNRFKGVIQIDPLAKDALDTIECFVSSLQNTVKFELSESWGWSGKYPNLFILDDSWIPIWEKINEKRLNVIIDPGSIFNNGYQIENLEKLVHEFPKIRFLIEHMAYPDRKIPDDRIMRMRWMEMIKLCKFKNVYLGLSAVPAILEDVFPCKLSLSLLEQVIETISSDKILWGSDVPITLNTYTYKQMIDTILKESNFLKASDREKILGLNAVHFFEL